MNHTNENIFDFYIEGGLDNLVREGWSDKKIARFLRLKATELNPRRKIKTIKISGREIIKMLDKKLKEDEIEEELR